MSPRDVRDLATDAANRLRRIWDSSGISATPHTAVILGSGLGAPGDLAERGGAITVMYSELPGMVCPLVSGHSGRILAGGQLPEGSILLQGRVHHYEGYSLDEITAGIRLLHQLGIRQVVITNAAGGIHSSFSPGDLMLISGHFTLVDLHSISGSSGQLSPSADFWDASLRQKAESIATPLSVHTGIYAMMPGPNYETPAEVRMLRFLGADAVGMSTIPEAIVARRLGMRVLGVSCITNAAAGLSGGPLSHDDVAETASSVKSEFTLWIRSFLSLMADECGTHDNNIGP